ncbi:MAG: hypothetical protein GY810_22180 [Aureispira sp.]|nr:hypothetical protein [Aureispira sp.]
MAFGGKMCDSLKNNKALRLNHKAFSKQKKDNSSYGDMTPLKFKKGSPEKLRALAVQIKREEMRGRIASIFGGLLAIALLIAFYYLGFVKVF